MKSLQKLHRLLILTLIIGFASCTEDSDLKKNVIEIQLSFPVELDNMQKEGHIVVLANTPKGYTVNATSNLEGNAVFEDIEPGSYTLSTSIPIVYLNRSRVLNGKNDIIVESDYSSTMILKMAEAGRFVISQFYYSGCLTEAGQLYYGDQFIEIYNNSEDVLYADGLSIVEHGSNGINPNYWNELEATYIVAKSIWTIPGSGNDVPVYPGKSLTIASNGFNYKSDVNGVPNSPVDLGNSDFEYHLYTESGRDIDYPDVPNLIEDLMVFRGTVSYFDVRGGSAMALAWLPSNRDSFINNNLVSKVSLNTISYFCKIPNEFVEDAVEVVLTDRTVYKRFDNSLDAGIIAVKAGSKSALCIRRKVEELVEERKILTDSNNSSEDFNHDVVPVPRFFE